jgi:hypothetical protein
MEAVGHAALAVMELKSALENAEEVTGAAVADRSIVELIAPAATDAAAAFAHLKNAMDCANADEEASYGVAGMGPGEWEKIARFLWGLLDNIDTLDDACKGNDGAFRKQARAQQKKRWLISDSDGHELTFRPLPHTFTEEPDAAGPV